MPSKKLDFNGLVKLFLDNESVQTLYDYRLFTYDYNRRFVLYNNKTFEVMLCGSLIKNTTGYEFKFSTLKEVLNFFAKMNTPRPDDSPDILLEPIQEYLEELNSNRIQIKDIILNVFSRNRMKDLTNKQLEMRIAACLNDLGWKKSRQSKGSFWIKNDV